MKDIRVIAKAVLYFGDKVLVLRRGNSAPKRPNEWDLPGGYVDDGEDYREACSREIAEESGIQISAENLYLAHAESKSNENGGCDSLLIFLGKANTKKVVLSFEHSEYDLVSLEDAIERETHPLHLNALNFIHDNNLKP